MSFTFVLILIVAEDCTSRAILENTIIPPFLYENVVWFNSKISYLKVPLPRLKLNLKNIKFQKLYSK